ncbi:MAG TPA: hypothetical protein VLH94_00120 [Spirochaetia bacterium]|nr:hypothetical protein [Spirochaetia bacterium]
MKNIDFKWLILLIVPIILIYKIFLLYNYEFGGVAGDFFSVINPSNSLISNSFAFRSNLNNGYADNTANMISHNSPYLIYELLLSKLGISQLVRTYLFIILLSVVGCFNMYYYLSSKNQHDESAKFKTLLLSILYGFFPYFIYYILPGHFLILLLPAFFPIIQLLFEKIIFSSKNDIKLSLKYFSILSFVLLFLCTPFANLGVFGVFYSLMVGQLILLLVLRQINLKQLTISFLLLSLSLLISNIWWLAPYTVTMGSISAMGEQSKQTIGSAIGAATIHSNVINTISGFPEGVNISFILSIIQIFLFLVIILSLFTSLLNRQKLKIELLLIILITIFFTKGPNAPFSFIFNFLYNEITLLQIIRRPASKLYWIIIFFLISLISNAILKNRNRRLNNLLNVSLSISVVLTVFVTIQKTTLMPFNIPETYYTANQYLIKNNVKKILLLPDIGGLNPEYNHELNFHKGIDFLGQIWEFKKYIPSSTHWNLSNKETDLVNVFANSIYNEDDFCEISKNLNVSHIVIRKDLLPTNYDLVQLNLADFYLSKSKLISKIDSFGNNFKIFQIVDECQSQIISTDSVDKSTFQIINPGLYQIKIQSNSDEVSIIFKEKFDKSWVLNLGSIANKKLNDYVIHDTALGYANKWTVDLASYCSTMGNKCQKVGGSYHLEVWIKYWPQYLHTIGLFISTVSYLFCIGYLIHFYRNNKISKQKK